MQGMCDSMWLLDRGDNSEAGSIIGRGRDIPDFQYALKWSAFTWSYKVEGSLPEMQQRENDRRSLSGIGFGFHSE